MLLGLLLGLRGERGRRVLLQGRGDLFDELCGDETEKLLQVLRAFKGLVQGLRGCGKVESSGSSKI